MTLTRRYLEKFDCNRKGKGGDFRKRGAWAVFSYYDENGAEYRKAFWGKANIQEDEMWNVAPERIEA